MTVGRMKKRGRKKVPNLEGVEFNIEAIKEIKKRKRRLRKRQSVKG